MNKITITRQNGNIPKSLPGEDHVSGLVFRTPPPIGGTITADTIYPCSSLDEAERLGLKSSQSSAWQHLADLFRVNPGVELYICFSTDEDYQCIGRMQNYAGGRIRQVGILDMQTNTASDGVLATNVALLQGVADALAQEQAPLSILYGVFAREGMPTNVASVGNSRVSVVIGGAMGAAGKPEPAIGVVLGLVSRAAVHQSIGWVKQFPTGVATPYIGMLGAVRDIDKATLASLDAARYIFLTTYPGIGGSYVNDSHTMDVATSDYAMIENVRTMDKAVRGIYTYLTPELGGNVYVDADTGKLQPYSVSHLENCANRALEDMAKAGELSGYKAEIDPEQDVLSTSTIEVVVKNVPVGVVRRINVKIGFTKTV